MLGGRILRTVLLFLILLTAVVALNAQIDRGTIQGAVRDQTGAVIPGAKVQIVRIDTNSALDLSTNEEGLYTAPNLPVGAYRVVVEQAGFATTKREPIEVQRATRLRHQTHPLHERKTLQRHVRRGTPRLLDQITQTRKERLRRINPNAIPNSTSPTRRHNATKRYPANPSHLASL